MSLPHTRSIIMRELLWIGFGFVVGYTVNEYKRRAEEAERKLKDK